MQRSVYFEIWDILLRLLCLEEVFFSLRGVTFVENSEGRREGCMGVCSRG